MQKIKFLQFIGFYIFISVISIQSSFANNSELFCLNDSDCTDQNQCTFRSCDKSTGKCSESPEDEYNWCEPVGFCNNGFCEIREIITEAADSVPLNTASIDLLEELTSTEKEYKIWEI